MPQTTPNPLAAEFNRRASMAGVRREYAHAGRTQDVTLTRNGETIGVKTIITSQGRPMSESYTLPPLTDARA